MATDQYVLAVSEVLHSHLAKLSYLSRRLFPSLSNSEALIQLSQLDLILLLSCDISHSAVISDHRGSRDEPRMRTRSKPL